MLNEHHSTPFCMQGVTNVGASILARQTSKAKIIILGNVLPIWDDPLWLAEQLAMIDMISGGRLVSGFVRGGGRESFAHNSPPHYNRERFEEAHDFIIKAWTTPGPWRWEGKHYQYRYVNPWMMPIQKPPPPDMDPVLREPRKRSGGPPSTGTRWFCWPPSWSPPRRPSNSTTTPPPSGVTNRAPRTSPTCGKFTWTRRTRRPRRWAGNISPGVSNPFLAGNEGTGEPCHP